MPAQRLIFAVAPSPFAIVVAFVSSDVDHGTHARGGAHGFEQVDGSHHIDGIRFDRGGVRIAHQRLGGEVENHLGLRGLHGACQSGGITDVGYRMRCHAFVDARNAKKLRLGWRIQRIARYVRSQRLQP